MKFDIVLKILSCLILIVIIVAASFIGGIMISLAGGQKFYAPLVLITGGVLIIFVIIGVFRFVKPKVFYLILISYFVVCALVITGYEIDKVYQKSITINDQGVDLEKYTPFAKHTKAVKLKEPSTFKIQSDLPVINGATALYPLYAAFVQATYPQREYHYDSSGVKCSSTEVAYQDLINGDVDLIFAACPSENQVIEAKSRGLEFKLTPIGREAFVFFVNLKNPVTTLSTSQIQAIYSGRITNWKELGGKDERIRAYQRPKNSGSQTILEKFMEDKELIAPPTQDIATGMGAIIEETANYHNYHNAIGYSFLYFAAEMVQNKRIRLLKVDGVYPSGVNIKNKSYPLRVDFYAITTNSNNPNLKSLINWILSPQGQYLVAETGYTPIK